MKLFIIKSIIILFLVITPFSIRSSNNENEKQDEYLGYINIPKINLKQDLYTFTSPKNDISKNVAIRKTSIKNTYLIMAHSGTGKLAYFNNLIYLEKGDIIYLKINNDLKKYMVDNIYRAKKNGHIKIKNKENMLILTTCDKLFKGYQLIIECNIE